MDIKTHLGIDRQLCGEPVTVTEGFSQVRLTTTAAMSADDSGLIHGGFVFGLADYAAMLAVNHPFVVLGAAVVKFLRPVSVGEVLLAEAGIAEQDGKKTVITVAVMHCAEKVFEGTFTSFVLDRHVLDPS